ncbi:MAG TPA: MBL fold metallo-hydrolase [Gemmatimonadaceae bacterium]
MFLRRFYDESLAQASYMIGCTAEGAALVVDPNRDVEQYLVAAAAEGVRLTHVTETHIHADFVSGSLQLARESGARLLLSNEGDEAWKYAFAAREGAELLRDGASFEIGAVRVDVVHTPGHTPEHITFLVTDTAVGDQPMGALTGDFIFVGDVGRPDLLERAANIAGTMEAGARELFRSLRRFAAFPDYLQLWPGHGAGSACGRALGAMPQTTLGYEKLFNWAFAVEDEDEFVRLVLAGQPHPPAYFGVMKHVNREGPAILPGLPHPRSLTASLLPSVLSGGALVVDTRPAAEFIEAHIPGSLSIPLNRSFSNWAGSLLPYDRDLYLIVEGTLDSARMAADCAARDLSLIGLDRVVGYVSSDALSTWQESGGTIESVDQLDAQALHDRMALEEIEVIDVRTPTEWVHEHIAGARNIPLGALGGKLNEIERGRPIVLQCESGNRSAIASSVLMSRGVPGVINLRGGIAAWRNAKLPVERPS